MTPSEAARESVRLLERRAAVPCDLLQIMAPMLGDSARWFDARGSGYAPISERSRVRAIIRLCTYAIQWETP